MRLRIPTILEIRDDRYIEEKIYIIDFTDRIYVAWVRWRCVILEAADGRHQKNTTTRQPK
jgi:hypothetical protein